MQFVPYRLLRNEPSTLRQKLEDEGQLVVTVDGKPFAIMIDLPEIENMEDILLLISRLRAQMAARAIRSQARRDGLDRLTDDQVNEVIAKTRRERKS
jgi:PHD/YefM family antitoxin component YafN of YafNO toxin-antitoxin module